MALMGPGKLPANIVSQLNQEVNRILRDPELEPRFKQVNFPIPVPTKTPEQFAETIRVDIEAWGRVTRAANIRIDN